MKIQSLSIVVPTKRCVNNCAFCVSKMHDNNYSNFIETNDELFEKDYKERLEFARDNGVNTIILTGTGEPLQNKKFIHKFSQWNKELYRPFHIIELQTTGTYLNDENTEFLKKINRKSNLEWLRKDVGVKTISLSISDLFDDENNLKIIDAPEKIYFKLDELCKKIKDWGFNLRISLNLLKDLEISITDKLTIPELQEKFESRNFKKIFNRVKELGGCQLTFRRIWTSDENIKVKKWIYEYAILEETFFTQLNNCIKKEGKLIGKLTFGAMQYDVDGVSTVLDSDCMNDDIKDELKYLILREDSKLYTKWNMKSSLIF